MSNGVGTTIDRAVKGQINQNQLSEAASDEVRAMPHAQLCQELRRTADAASSGGDDELAGLIRDVLSQHESNEQTLQGEAVSLISNNPRILQHVTPRFAEAIVSHLQAV